MKRETLPTWVWFLPAVFSMLVALLPVFRGRPLNVVLFCVGVVWLILGLAIAKKRREGPSGKDPPL